MADKQSTADVQAPAPAGSDSPVLTAFNKKAKALREKQGSQLLDTFNGKIKSLREKQGNQLLDTFNSKLSAVRASQPAPQPQAGLPEITPWNPNWHERLFGTGGFSGAVQEARMAGIGGDKTEVVKAFLNHPLAAIDELIFPGNQRTKTGQFLKSATGTLSGLTSPTMMGVTAGSYLAGIGEAKSVVGGLHALGTAMMPTMGIGAVQSVKKIKQAREAKNSEAEMEGWGELAGTIALIVVPHVAGEAVGHFTGRDFDVHSKYLYGKKFSALDDSQKLNVVYKASVDANPKLAKKIERETQRINSQKVPGEGGRTVAEVRATEHNDTVREYNEQQVKLQAYKTVLDQVLRQHAADEHYRKTQADAEVRIHAENARRSEIETRKADEVPSVEQERGFAVTDNRSTSRGERGVVMTTGREQYPVHAPGTAPEPVEGIPTTDTRRFAEQQVVAPGADRGVEAVLLPVLEGRAGIAAETPIQEYAEKNHGASFSSLPLDQQRIVASHFERTSPEQWQAFQRTQAYDAYKRHADAVDASAPALKRWSDQHEGTGEPLAPGADIHAGVARLLIQHADIPASLKADPKLYQSVNQYAEQHFGKSYDSLDEGHKPAALAGFLRENPDSLDKFVTPDVRERMGDGQHVDLANMEAALADKQQIKTLMEYRDDTRRVMDEQFAGEVVRQERAKHVSDMQELVRNSPATETTAGDSIATQAKGLTQLAERINLEGIKDKGDLFEVEKAIRKVPATDRTPDMQQYLAQIRQLRAAANTELVRQYREGLIDQMRADLEGGRESAAREVVTFEDQRHAAVRLANDNSGEHATPEQKAEAQDLQDTAAFLRRKEDAAVAAVRVAEGAKAQPAGESIPFVMGRATYIELNSGERVPAHYAVAEMPDLIASHNPLENFAPDSRFPTDAQPRNYQDEPELQVSVHEKANSPNADVYHSDTIHPTDGPPIVRKDGVVLSGNGREQGAEEAVNLGNWESVRKDLLDKARRFGINPDEIAKHKNPILVRVMDATVTDPTELARYGIEMNRDAGQGMSATEQSAALSRMLTPKIVERMANVFRSVSGDSSLRDAMRARSKDLAEILTDAGLVDPKKRSAYFTDDGELTESAKMLIENTLAGVTVSNPAVLDSASDSVKSKLGRVGMDFILMRAAGSNWNLASYNTDAVSLLTQVEDASTYLRNMEGPGTQGDEKEGTYSLVERRLHPERFRLSNLEMAFDGQPTHPPVHPVVEALAMALEKNPRAYANLIGDYAEAAAKGGMTIYGAMNPADVFNEYVAGKFGLNIVPDEWGMVNGLPDSVKAELEDSRGPLPVEPAANHERVAEDVQPDTTSVDDAEKGDGPRTVREFRDALANHPNITEEQAEAITTTFETILPRAIGESFEDLLKNRRLSLRIGGEEGENRGYTEFINEANAAIHLFDKADPSTVMHEMFHFLRRYVKPENQAALNEFVGAKPGEAWTPEQEEFAAKSFERYHFDGGRRRGALDKAFATIHKAMQSVYDAVTAMGLAKPSQRITEMFDHWYDWERSDRKPITARIDVDALVEATKNAKVELPADAKLIDGSRHSDPNDRTLIFMSRGELDHFRENSRNRRVFRQAYQSADGKTFYAKVKAGSKLYQPGVSLPGMEGADEERKAVAGEEEGQRLTEQLRTPKKDISAASGKMERESPLFYGSEASGQQRLFQSSIGDLARQAKALEDQLKQTKDPRDEARLRAQLNSVENKLGASTIIFRRPEPKNNEATQLIYGIGEMPSVHEPTTPAQAMSVRQVQGDPTEVEARANGKQRVSDETAQHPEQDGTAKLPEQAGSTDRGNKATGRVLRGVGPNRGGTGKEIAKPETEPLAKVPAAKLKAPERQRGTPVVDPEAWRGYAEALGLPQGTPPPTVRLPDDLRDMMIYPGQSEAIEVALSGLQQHDGIVVASAPGTGKTWMSLAIADQLLGQDSSKVGLIVTLSKNLIHGADGYTDIGNRMGVQVEGLPKEMGEIKGGGVYAATYSGLRGDKNILTVPWDFVIFDESASARKWTESAQGEAAVLLGHAAKKAIYMSATPWHTALEVGYAHKLGLWPEGGFFEWGRQFGLVEIGPNSYSGGYAPKRMMKLRQQLIERGQWVALPLDMDGVTAHVAMVKQTPEVKDGIKSVRDAFGLATKVFQQRGQMSMVRALKGNEVTYLKRFIEASRLPQVLKVAKDAIAKGWNPVLFSEYRSGSKTEVDGKIDDIFSKLPPGVGDAVRAMLPKLPNLVEAVRKELGEDAAIFAGDANQVREEERTQFQAGKKKALFGTYAAGGTGVNFDDKVGEKPRMGLFLGPPWSGIMFDQSRARTWRYTTKSNVTNIFFTSDALPEVKVLATKTLPRLRALGAAVYGEEMESSLSKKLRESAGIPEEMIDYEMGNEASVDAAQFAQMAEGAGYTLTEDLKMPKASDSHNKGYKHKQQPKRLYQGPKNPLGDDAAAEFDKINLDALPPSMRRAIQSRRIQTQAAAYDAGLKAVPGVESPKQGIERVTKDSAINAKLAYAMYDFKKDSRSFVQWTKEQDRIYNTAGDRDVWKYMEDSGVPRVEAKDFARMMRLRKYKAIGHFGDIMTRVGEIVEHYDVKTEQEHVIRVLEGKEEASNPRIQAAADGWRDLFAYIRKKLADAGAVFESTDQNGKPRDIPWKDFVENPHYWPHMWDWDQKLQLTGADGKPHIATLGELHDMVPGEQRDKMVQEYAEKYGLNKLEAEKFFSKNRRTVRLAPNLERTRDTNAANYDTSLRTVEIYAQQVAEMLANIETVGQKREKINARIFALPVHAMKMVDSIITGDLNPLSIGSDNQTALRVVTRAEILSKMGLSVFKLPGHALLKVPMLTSRWSTFVGGMNLAGEVARAVLTGGKSKMEVVQMCREYGIFSDYVRQAMAMEYGLRAKGGIDRKLLTYTGFTSGAALSRALGGAAARHWLTIYAQRALMKNPGDMVVRRRMSEAFAFSNEDMDRIAKEGINHEDVKQAMIAGAEWTTGGGRASEIPPYLRSGDDHPISSSMRTAARMAWTLRGFTFKTESLMNRLVFDELREGNVKPALNFLINAGCAGMATTLLQMGVNSLVNKPSYEEQKRRFEAIPDHKMGALWMELSLASFAIGNYPLKIIFDHLGTYDPKDKKVAANQSRLAKDEANALSDQLGGIVLRDAENAVQGGFEVMATFEDDGINHKKTPSERRDEILHRMTVQSVPTLKPLFAIHDALTTPAAPSPDSAYIPHRRARHGKAYNVPQ